MFKIATVSLPPEKSKGGIDAAIEGIESVTQGDQFTFTSDIDSADIVHFHGLWQLSHSQLSKRLRKEKKPYIVSPHGMLEPWAFQNKSWKKKPYFKWLESKHLEHAHRLFVTSELERKHVYERIKHNNIDVLPLGCSDPKQPNYQSSRNALNWGESETILLYLSRIDRKKGLHLLLHSLADKTLETDNTRLVVVGSCDDPSYQSEIDDLKKQLADDLPKIDWVGPVWGQERWQYLQGADLFCLPTHSENFGIAVIEALHAGTPVLTTTGTPWSEYSDHSHFFIAQPEIKSVTEMLRAFIQTPKISLTQRDELGKWTHKNYSWDQLEQHYQNAYKSAIESAHIL